MVAKGIPAPRRWLRIVALVVVVLALLYVLRDTDHALQPAQDPVPKRSTSEETVWTVSGPDSLDWEDSETQTPLCPLHSPELGIHVPVNVTEVTYDEVRSLYPMVQRGGYYAPSECRSHNKTAIVIPYRDREKNLMILLRNLIPFLIKQKAEFRLFVSEQTKENAFNKGVLLNVAYLEVKRLYNFTCFMFHDSDYVPLDYRNVYTCATVPKHLLVSRSELKHLGPMYPAAFGGAITFTRKMFELVNGFSNRYYGWGKEDDDLRRRFHLKGIGFIRIDKVIGMYRNLPHDLQKRNKKRNGIYKKILGRADEDGLNTVMAESVHDVRVEEKDLFTHILVHVRAPPADLYH